MQSKIKKIIKNADIEYKRIIYNNKDERVKDLLLDNLRKDISMQIWKEAQKDLFQKLIDIDYIDKRDIPRLKSELSLDYKENKK